MVSVIPLVGDPSDANADFFTTQQLSIQFSLLLLLLQTLRNSSTGGLRDALLVNGVSKLESGEAQRNTCMAYIELELSLRRERHRVLEDFLGSHLRIVVILPKHQVGGIASPTMQCSSVAGQRTRAKYPNNIPHAATRRPHRPRRAYSIQDGFYPIRFI